MKSVFVCLNHGVVTVVSLPPGYAAEIIDLDAIADDPVNEFGKLSRGARAFVIDQHPHVVEIEADPKAECQNCGRIVGLSFLGPVKHLFGAGEWMPAGECPVCGAVCHEVNPDKTG